MNVLVVLLVIAFDLLFYKQVPGINVSIFCLLLISACIYQKPKLKLDNKWLLIAANAMLTSIFVGIYSDILSVLACLIAVSLLAAYTAEKKSSILIAISGAALSYLRSPFIIIKMLRLQLIKWQSKKEKPEYG